MIIAFEGLDGSGKSATTPLVAAELAARGYSATPASKRETAVQGAFAREQVQALAAMLWETPHDSRLNSVGALHWVYLNGAYFAATHHALTAQLEPKEIVIMDNWINKFVARIVSNGDFGLDQVVQSLALLPQPDIVFLLDVPSAVAVQRKKYSQAESGALSRGNLDAYTFQDRVGEKLRMFAAARDWIIITPQDRTADEIAMEVTEHIVARLETRN